MRKRLKCYHWIWLALMAKFGWDMLGTWVKKRGVNQLKKSKSMDFCEAQDSIQGQEGKKQS